jgi:hypothetical protein
MVNMTTVGLMFLFLGVGLILLVTPKLQALVS